MASAAARMFVRMQRNRGVRRAEAFALSRARRYAATAARRVKGFVRKNPFTAGTFAGSAANDLLRGVKRYSRKGGLKGKRKARRIGPAVKPPTTTSSRVPARFAVADRMTKFKKAKPTAQKVPKSAIVHYKEFGSFEAEKCMYINHEHFGSIDKMWLGIGYGLTKLLLGYAKVYNGKSMEDPCIGPRSNYLEPATQMDDKSAASIIRLVFITEGQDGGTGRTYADVPIEDVSLTPDRYYSFAVIAGNITNNLKAKYADTTFKTWLSEAQIITGGNGNAEPIYIQNLDDAEVHLYVNSLLKFQNVTIADHGTGSGANPYDKSAIDANPLVGRCYTAKGHYPHVDSDLLQSGNRSLDNFFGDVDDSTKGITLLGHGNTVTADDLGRISSIPQARELYGNQTVKSATIHMPAGAMKFHKTGFSLVRTFRSLSNLGFLQLVGAGVANTGNAVPRIGSHTLFGFTLQHKHGEDSIKIGYNRETDVGCYVKHKRIVHPLKTNKTLDSGVVTTSVVPTEHL